MKITPGQKKILESLFFEENFESICAEIIDSRPNIADDLKTLITKDLVNIYEEVNGRYELSDMYDADDMNAYFYRISAKGITLLEK